MHLQCGIAEQLVPIWFEVAYNQELPVYYQVGNLTLLMKITPLKCLYRCMQEND